MVTYMLLMISVQLPVYRAGQYFNVIVIPEYYSMETFIMHIENCLIIVIMYIAEAKKCA